MGIGARLSKILEEKHTNVNELANRANVSASTLYSIIQRDSTKADIDILIAIAKVLGVSVEYFGESDYYTNPETAKAAQDAYDQNGVLFDAAKGLKPESIKEVLKFIEFQKAKENHEDKD